jgi:hypothetical protein
MIQRFTIDTQYKVCKHVRHCLLFAYLHTVAESVLALCVGHAAGCIADVVVIAAACEEVDICA